MQGRLGARFALDPAVSLAYRWYLRTDRTPAFGYSAMRKLFGSPRGWRLDELAARATAEHPPLDLSDPNGLISQRHDVVVEALQRDGYVVLESRLAKSECDALSALAAESICDLVDPAPGAPAHARFDPTHAAAVRYDIPERTLLGSPAVQRLLTDQSVLSVAQRYLGGVPVQDLVAMWWTAASPGSSSSRAAQQFHFDLDRLRFLKLFVYLTDVTADTGPHVYVRGSHRDLPTPLREDRRFDDAEVAQHFAANDVVSIAGPRGTVFLADTRGLHKGLPVASGHRLVFQLEYASSLFGAPVTWAELEPGSPALASAFEQHPVTYRRLAIRA